MDLQRHLPARPRNRRSFLAVIDMREPKPAGRAYLHGNACTATTVSGKSTYD